MRTLTHAITGYITGSRTTARFDDVLSTWQQLPEEHRDAQAMRSVQRDRNTFVLLGTWLPTAIDVASVAYGIATRQPAVAAIGVLLGEYQRMARTLDASHDIGLKGLYAHARKQYLDFERERQQFNHQMAETTGRTA